MCWRLFYRLGETCQSSFDWSRRFEDVVATVRRHGLICDLGLGSFGLSYFKVLKVSVCVAQHTTQGKCVR